MMLAGVGVLLEALKKYAYISKVLLWTILGGGFAVFSLIYGIGVFLVMIAFAIYFRYEINAVENL
jgi:hypothetical protein